MQSDWLAAELPRAGERLQLPDAELTYYPAFYSTPESADIRSRLCNEIPWQQTQLNIAGKQVQVPRLQSWHGDRSSEYGYSGMRLHPNPWTPLLQKLREDLQESLSLPFNSVLLNWYRNGKDSVAWHSDDERELGADPAIASLSFGVARRFDLKHRHQQRNKFSIELGDGSLLLMGTGVQQHYLHQVPKQPVITAQRLNLTFRFIHALA